LLLAAQPEISGAALHDLFEAEAREHWKKGQPLREVNVALRRAAPAERRALMQRLYSFEPDFLAHFHAGRLDLVERLRLRRLIRA
jgi:lycopene beta-cyclase